MLPEIRKKMAVDHRPKCFVQHVHNANLERLFDPISQNELRQMAYL